MVLLIEAMYEDDEDQQRFLEVLGNVIDRCCWIYHGYCLITTTCERGIDDCSHLLNFDVFKAMRNKNHFGKAIAFDGTVV